MSPVPPPPCKVKVLVLVALSCGFVPPNKRLPEFKTGIWLPLADCEGLKPVKVFALIANPAEVICCLGESVSKLEPLEETSTCK